MGLAPNDNLTRINGIRLETESNQLHHSLALAQSVAGRPTAGDRWKSSIIETRDFVTRLSVWRGQQADQRPGFKGVKTWFRSCCSLTR